ncbi:MAG: NAD(P)-dependent oxidoreductase [Planctomycetota bacterium]
MPTPLPPDQRRKVLLTGAAGAIGRCVAPALVARGHDVRGFDRLPCPGLADHVVGDLADADDVDRAAAGRDTLVHLAAYPDPAPFVDTLLGPNVAGLYRVVDTALRHGLSRLVLASSIQVVSGARRRETQRTITARDAAPVNDYALTKLWAEQLGAMAARNHPGVSVVAARIGWFVRNLGEARRILDSGRATGVYFSHDDARRFFAAAVENDLPPHPDNFATVYAVGPGDGEHPSPYDLGPGRELLGYLPQDVFPQGLADDIADAL